LTPITIRSVRGSHSKGVCVLEVGKAVPSSAQLPKCLHCRNPDSEFYIHLKVAKTQKNMSDASLQRFSSLYNTRSITAPLSVPVILTRNKKSEVFFCSITLHLLIYFGIANMFYYILKLIFWFRSGDLQRRGRRTFPTSIQDYNM